MNITEVAHFESLYPAESRQGEIEKVLGYIRQGQSCQVLGLPGVGQSTFLKLLAYNRNVRLKHLGEKHSLYHFVLVNFSEVRTRPLIEVTKFIFLSLLDSLRERGLMDEHESIVKIFKESTASSDELIMFQGLKQALDFLMLEKDLTIVLLLDRFEEYIPMLTEGFFANLRTLRNRGKHKFSVVASLNRSLEESVESALTMEFGEYISNNVVYLSLVEKVILEFRIKQIEELSRKTLTDSQKEQIISLTGGFGRLMKNCAHLILNQEKISPVDLAVFLLSQQSIQKPLIDIWEALTPSEQDFLLSNDNYESLDVDYPYLEKIGLLRNNKIAIPLLHDYIRQELGEREKIEEKQPITYFSDTNEIKKGTDLISDRLTSLEFKLLKFLLHRPDMVVDREAIVGAVWSDAASVAGVTEQALDQLLFRLRKKIEEDPNNPKHLKTVKGRGIKFTP